MRVCTGEGDVCVGVLCVCLLCNFFFSSIVRIKYKKCNYFLFKSKKNVVTLHVCVSNVVGIFLSSV